MVLRSEDTVKNMISALEKLEIEGNQSSEMLIILQQTIDTLSEKGILGTQGKVNLSTRCEGFRVSTVLFSRIQIEGRVYLS